MENGMQLHFFKSKINVITGLLLLGFVALVWLVNVVEFTEYPKYINRTITVGWPFAAFTKVDDLYGDFKLAWMPFVGNIVVGIILAFAFAVLCVKVRQRGRF